MELTNKQKAFLEFIPVSDVRKTVLRMYAITLYLVPLLVDYYFDNGNINYQWLKVIALIDAILIIASIPVLIKPKALLGVFHLLNGFSSIFISMLLFFAFVIEANLIHQKDIVNLTLSIVIYLVALFTENFLIIRTNFLKHPKSNSKMKPIFVLAPVIGMLCYNLFGANMFKINGMAVASFILAIAFGIPIHSLYRGYIILKYKYRPLDL